MDPGMVGVGLGGEDVTDVRMVAAMCSSVEVGQTFETYKPHA